MLFGYFFIDVSILASFKIHGIIWKLLQIRPVKHCYTWDDSKYINERFSKISDVDYLCDPGTSKILVTVVIRGLTLNLGNT